MVARRHSRREMLKMLGISPIVWTLPVSPLRMQSNLKEQPQLCPVSRHVQSTDMEEGAEAGFKAIAWTVRAGAHMEPEQVERALPKAVEFARKAGLSTPMLITAIVDAQSLRAEAILDTMRSVGIRRYRAPTGWVALERPVRYVLEYAYTRFLGDLEGALGFTYVNSFGAGLELDTSHYDGYATRLRLLLRYKVGDHVTGWAVGLAASF